jgi:hypothetical protein
MMLGFHAPHLDANTTSYFIEPVIFVWLVQRPNRMRYSEL